MKKYIYSIFIITFFNYSFSQTGRVGINTENPQNTLHIDGGRDNPVTGTPSDAQQANDVIITNDGKIGIGTTIPNNSLNISKKGSSTGIINPFVEGITITADANSTAWTGPGIYLEEANALAGQKLFKLNYSKNTAGNSFLNFQAVSDDASSSTRQVMSVYHNGNIGIGGSPNTNPAAEKLDVIEGNVRVRTINLNTGNTNTDKLLVADSDGVLKTVAKSNPLLTGGTLADAISAITTITATAGAPDNGNKAQSLISYTFTLAQKSLVTFNYQLSFGVPTTGLTNTMKIIRSYLAFTAGSMPLNQQFGYESTSHNAITGRPGFFYHTANESLILQPGSYTVQLYGNAVNTTTASEPDFSVEFGGGSDRFTVIATPVY
ncbi:hypothetical protein [Epilithonimonas sp.]|uniref:hypothetical protein n=1 Tax=Epilithonimonas sp. TaxID=2894511 RepID=UPI0035B13F0B